MNTTAQATTADQAAALRAMLTLAEQNPALPAAYTVISSITPDEVAVQLEGPGELEAWRAALDVGPESVRFRAEPDRQHLHFTVQINATRIYAYTVFDPAADEGPGCAA